VRWNILFTSCTVKLKIATSNLQERLLRYNQKSKGFTGSRNDWQTVHSERFFTKTEAMKRELQIKRWKSRFKIEALLDTDTPT
jgi:putative endonuclease